MKLWRVRVNHSILVEADSVEEAKEVGVVHMSSMDRHELEEKLVAEDLGEVEESELEGVVTRV